MRSSGEILAALHAAHSAHAEATGRARAAVAALPPGPQLLEGLLRPGESFRVTHLDRSNTNVAASDPLLLAPLLTVALSGGYATWLRSATVTRSTLSADGMHVDGGAPPHVAGGTRADVLNADRTSTDRWALARTPLWTAVMDWWAAHAHVVERQAALTRAEAQTDEWQAQLASLIARSVAARIGHLPTAIIRRPPPTARMIVGLDPPLRDYAGPPLARLEELDGYAYGMTQEEIDAARSTPLAGEELPLAAQLFEVADTCMAMKLPDIFDAVQASSVTVRADTVNT